MPEQNLVSFAWYHEGYGWVARTSNLGCYNVDSYQEATCFDSQTEANLFQDKYNPDDGYRRYGGRKDIWTLHEILTRISRV